MSLTRPLSVEMVLNCVSTNFSSFRPLREYGGAQAARRDYESLDLYVAIVQSREGLLFVEQGRLSTNSATFRFEIDCARVRYAVGNSDEHSLVLYMDQWREAAICIHVRPRGHVWVFMKGT